MNEGVIAPGNQLILIRCAEHHPYWRNSIESTQSNPDTSVALIIVNCQLSTVNLKNCQLSTVNC